MSETMKLMNEPCILPEATAVHLKNSQTLYVCNLPGCIDRMIKAACGRRFA